FQHQWGSDMGEAIVPSSDRVWARRHAGYLPSAAVALAVGAVLLRAPLADAQTPALKIAVALSLTGPSEGYGGAALDGARLAIEEANAAASQPRIELVVHDDASDPDKGREIAGQLVAEDALAVIGPATTPMSLAVGPIYAQAGLVSIGTTTTGDGVTANSSTFRAIFSTGDGGELLANYLRHILHGTRAVVLFKDDGYGRPAADGFRRAAERLGITT